MRFRKLQTDTTGTYESEVVEEIDPEERDDEPGGRVIDDLSATFTPEDKPSTVRYKAVKKQIRVNGKCGSRRVSLQPRPER